MLHIKPSTISLIIIFIFWCFKSHSFHALIVSLDEVYAGLLILEKRNTNNSKLKRFVTFRLIT